MLNLISKITCFLMLFLILLNINAHAQFHPPAGLPGSSAIYKDSNIFVSWATSCSVTRGFMNISNPSLGYASAGEDYFAIGKAGENGVVSLGDGGAALLTFDKPIINGQGYDFAVFENSFNDSFLELAYVEVSSDGINFFRFNATSYTPSASQIGSFNTVDATHINNLAGKYRALYGTPFDLEELEGQIGLDLNNILFVRIIDVIGCIQSAYASYDFYGNIINDPWPTAFASGGFDLDAVGVINRNEYFNVNEMQHFENDFIIFPTITGSDRNINIVNKTNNQHNAVVNVFASAGNQLNTFNINKAANVIDLSSLNAGVYLIEVLTSEKRFTKRIILTY